MRSLRIPCCLFALVFVAFAAQPADAQDNPDFEIGLKPYGSYHGGNIDQVNLGNGSLSVDIPLISYPQRGGKLTLDFALHYFNGSSYQTLTCYSEPFGSECVEIPSGSYSGFEIIDKQAFTLGPPLGLTGYQSCSATTQPPVVFCNLQVSDTDGASHLYAPINTASTSYRSLDATGILGASPAGDEGATSFTDSQGIVHTNVQYGVLA